MNIKKVQIVVGLELDGDELDVLSKALGFAAGARVRLSPQELADVRELNARLASARAGAIRRYAEVVEGAAEKAESLAKEVDP